MCSFAARVWRLLREEALGVQPRLLVARGVMKVLPSFVGGRVRACVLRFAGFHVGGGTVIAGAPLLPGPLTPQAGLWIGSRCFVNVGCLMDVIGGIVIGDGVHIGQQVALITQTHQLGDARQRAGALQTASVRVEEGAWLGARAVILPGVTVGAGAVVAAGAVVIKDVAPHTVVAGVPARVVKDLGTC